MPVLRFEKTLIAKTEVANVWDEFELAFKDSLESRIWPNHLESIRSEGLAPGNKVLVEYHFPLLSAWSTTVKRTYQILEVQPRLFFRYTPMAHTFTGEARVVFEAVSEGETRVIWSGEYSWSGFPWTFLFFKLYFEKQFFSALQKSFDRLKS